MIEASLLDIANLDVRYGRMEAVRQLDLAVAERETVALVGESGCGKSTSALAVMGLLPEGATVTGEARFRGQNFLQLAPAALRSLRGGTVSMVFQDSATSLNPVLTVGSQIAEVLQIHAALSRRDARQRAVELLDLVEIPNVVRRIDDYPHEFSGGQRQRVAIAMAVACRPQLLIADEPTTALDTAIQAKILRLLDKLKRDFGMGLLLITHDLSLVAQWADRVAIMLRGAKIEEGHPDRIFSQPSHPYTRTLLDAARSLDGKNHYRSVRFPTPSSAACCAPQVSGFPHRTAPVPLLSLKDVHTRYAGKAGTVEAVRGVSFDIVPGETLGLVGGSGCGKSTLSRTILRLLPASKGSILFEGSDITAARGKALRNLRRRVQMVFQDPFGSLNPRQTIGEMMHATLKLNGMESGEERLRRIGELMDRVQLSIGSLGRYPHEFSGGQRQRIAIARALLLRPSLLICDEPASSLDLPIRAQVLNLLVELKTIFGLSYLFISHDLSVVRYMADRILVMESGRIVEQGDAGKIWSDPEHRYTRSLIRAMPSLLPASIPSQAKAIGFPAH